MSTPNSQLATVQPIEQSPVTLIQAVIDRGLTTEGVQVVKELVLMQREQRQFDAQMAFNSSFVALQDELGPVTATKAVPDKQNNVKYTYAPFEEIMAMVKPLLSKHGFAITFDSHVADGRIHSKCTLLHRDGHSKENTFAVRIGGGPPGSNESQADGSASTYAKRFALCNALNIVVEQDDDARAIGSTSPISKEKAAELERRCKACGADIAAFLKFAGAANFDAIPADRLERVEKMLSAKEASTKKTDADGNYTWA